MRFRTVRRIDGPALHLQIGRKLKAIRTARGLTQEVIAVHLGVTRASIANLEGGRQAPMIATLYDLSLFYKVPIRRLLP